MNTTKPLVSVITVVLNAKHMLERTLPSIREQRFDNFEYLVVDGASTDGTLELIRQNEAMIDNWVSEKDSGIWNAMNKAAQMAKGEWIIFMNAGDTFVDGNVLSNVFLHKDYVNVDVIYGDGIYNYGDYRLLETAPEHISLRHGAEFSHQSSFVRADVQRRIGFDEKEKLAADYDFFLKIHKSGGIFRRAPVVVSEFYFGGFSNRPPAEVSKLRHRIYGKYYKSSSTQLKLDLLKIYTKELAKLILPKRTWNAIKMRAIAAKLI